MSKVLGEPTRREAFLSLVRLQDHGCAVRDSREQVAAIFHVDVSLVLLIEREGLRKQWPPLNRDFAGPLPLPGDDAEMSMQSGPAGLD